MNKDYVEKNLMYQDEIKKIARCIFYKFYNKTDDLDWHEDLGLKENFDYDSSRVVMPKAEKIYSFFNSSEEAIKAINFLHITNPSKAKEIIEGL